MTATLLIDQAGLPAGSSGFARTDGLDTGALVTVQSVGAATTATARLLTVPDLDTTAASSFTQTSSSPPTWTFSPTANVDGMYRIELITDNGLGSQDRQVRVFGIRDSNALLFPSFGLAADPLANLGDLSDAQKARAFIMANELNEVRAGYPSGYPFGYQAELDLILRTAASGSATPPGTGALLWEWDGATLDGIDPIALDYERDLGTPVPNAATALILDVHALGGIYGNVLRVVATALAGGGIFRIANTITLPESYVIQARFVGVVGTASAFESHPIVPMYTDVGTDDLQAVLYRRNVGFSAGQIDMVVNDINENGLSVNGSGSTNQLQIDTGGVLLTCTVHKRQAGETPSRVVLATRDESWGQTTNSPIDDGSIPSDDADVNTQWDGVDLDRCGFGAMGLNATESGTFYIASIGVYERPAL